MPPLLDRKTRFSHVAYAIEATPKTLRNWLQRDQVRLPSGEPPAGGWRDFAAVDVLVLALVRKLVEFGVTVERASELASEAMGKTTGPLLAFDNAPVAALIAGMRGKLLLIWRHPPGGAWHGDLTHVGALDQLPSDATLLIQLERLAAETLRRVAEARVSQRASDEQG